MKIQPSRLLPSRCAPSFQPPDSRFVAADLLENRELAREDRVFLQGNVGHYVAKLPRREQKTARVEKLLERLENRESLPPETARWTVKISRDLRSAYTDAAVLQKAERLDSDLKTFASHYPGQVYVVGGVAENDGKGGSRARFGGESDLDIVTASPLSESSSEALRSLGWKVSEAHPESAQSIHSPNGFQGLLYPGQAAAEKALNWFGGSLLLEAPQSFDVPAWIQDGACARGMPLGNCQEH